MTVCLGNGGQQVNKINQVYHVNLIIKMQCLINKNCLISHSQTCSTENFQCIRSGIQVYRKHSFLYFYLAELSLYSGPLFHQVAKTQTQLALTESPPGLCLQKCQVGGHLALSVISCPCWHPLRLSPFSLVCGPGPSRSPCSLLSLQGFVKPAGSLCTFHWRNFVSPLLV